MLDVVAVREDDGTYRVTVAIANKSGHGVDLLYDCGWLLRLQRSGRAPAPDPERICPTVHSQGLSAGATERLAFDLDPHALDDGEPLHIGVVYETKVDGSHRVSRELWAVLEPVA